MVDKSIDIQRIVDITLDKIHTICEAKIIKVDNSKLIADVKLLKKLLYRGKEYEVGIIKNVPIKPISHTSKYSDYTPFFEEDKVTVAFYSDNALETLNSKNPTGSYDKTKFNVNSCVIIGGTWENRGLTNPFPNDRVMINRETEEYFRIKSSGGLEAKGDFHIIGNITNTGAITSSGEITDGNGLKVSREHRYYDDGNPAATQKLP